MTTKSGKRERERDRKKTRQTKIDTHAHISTRNRTQYNMHHCIHAVDLLTAMFVWGYKQLRRALVTSKHFILCRPTQHQVPSTCVRSVRVLIHFVMQVMSCPTITRSHEQRTVDPFTHTAQPLCELPPLLPRRDRGDIWSSRRRGCRR